MRVLLTGATGQVGRTVATHLIARGHELAGVSRSGSVPSGIAQHIQVTLGTEDCIDRILASIQPCEAIVHAAASLSYSPHDREIALTNCWGTQQLLRLLEAWHSRSLIFMSSLHLIGHPRDLPITEDHPAHPTTAYHASKFYGEFIVGLAERLDCAATSLRITSPSGPATPSHRVMAVFVRRAMSGHDLILLGHGTRRQNYVDSRDVARAVEACLIRRANGVYNIAGLNSVSNLELAEECIRELSSRSIVKYAREADPEEGINWDVSIAKAQRDLGFQPHFTLRESIRAIANECPVS